ncbi:MAG: prolyl oligopeptidase family serine peptidase [Cryomorphaceae bacterium]|nr:prolyl oligopeptidase family serine peptidase [Cryomorphaceae bacterium]
MRILLSFFALVCSALAFAQEGFLTKQVVNLAVESCWDGISENGELNEEFRYLDDVVIYEMTYLSQNHVVRGFIVEPKVVGKYPVIIFNRGGNRDFASLDAATMINYTSKLAAAGFVIMASNLRNADEYGGEELNDVLALFDLSNEIEKADTSQIGMFGWSRGGMTSYQAMAKTKRLKTVVVGNGATNLFDTLKERPGLEKTVFSQCIPDYEKDKKKALEKRSALFWTSSLNQSTSLLILAGANDKRVDHHQAIEFSEKLKETEIRFELKIFETDHFFSDHKDILHDELITWFNNELKTK